jgi:hypothetical protein
MPGKLATVYAPLRSTLRVSRLEESAERPSRRGVHTALLATPGSRSDLLVSLSE